ncbi:MAG: PCRF domain-containing protein [Candidatus Omnitrophica bacterium]|nr:PCRF domain-containing protein [Candidatus Omnitrophota bacterium]
MDENLKNRVLIILAVLAAIFFIGSVSSCAGARKQKMARDKEMATRLDLEEKMSKFSSEKASLEAKIKSLNQELETEKASQETVKKALLQEQLVNQSLKEELQKVNKLKEALEEDLKDALSKSSKPKR